jgi:hypothetical protein
VAAAKKRTLWLLLALLGAGGSPQALASHDSCAADLLARHAGETLSYRVDWKGFSLDSVRQIAQLEDGRWEAQNRSSLLFMAIEERSHFALDGGQIRSLEYRYDRQGLSNKHDLRLVFGSGYYDVFSPRGDGRMEVAAPVYDLLNHQLQMRIDLACDAPRPHYRYPIARRTRVSDYRYRRVGEESVTTPAGTFTAVVLERGEADDKLDRVWLAPALDYLIVRLVHQEDDERAELQLLRDPRLSGGSG